MTGSPERSGTNSGPTCRIPVPPLSGIRTLRPGFLEPEAALTAAVFSCSATGTGGEEVVMVACGWGDTRIGAGLTRLPAYAERSQLRQSKSTRCFTSAESIRLATDREKGRRGRGRWGKRKT